LRLDHRGLRRTAPGSRAGSRGGRPEVHAAQRLGRRGERRHGR
jgi:hypothetical protein